jgi:hypothetical protein
MTMNRIDVSESFLDMAAADMGDLLKAFAAETERLWEMAEKAGFSTEERTAFEGDLLILREEIGRMEDLRESMIYAAGEYRMSELECGQ